MKKRRSKKAISVMIAYIILISIALTISPFVYNYLKTYIQGKDTPECPSDVSLFVKKLNRTEIESKNIVSLNITLKNTGLFSLGGYLIKTSPNEDTLATNDISRFVLGKTKLNPGVKFDMAHDSTNLNSFAPGDETVHVFRIENPSSEINVIEITPVMWIEKNGEKRFAICYNSKIKEIISKNSTGFGN